MMGMLRLLSKVAFICNGCFLLAIAIVHFHPPLDPGLSSFLLILGFFLSVVFNGIVNLWLGAMLFAGGSVIPVPVWQRVTNFIFLIIQLTFILI